MPRQSEGNSSESRFSALLNPIRDIASSWGIDIARELSEYAECLGIDLDEQVDHSEDNESNAVDFAEAALLVSGSASIYSRKVEHLYALVYVAVSALNQVQAKQSGRTGRLKSPTQDDPDADALLEVDEDDFLTLDDDIPQAAPCTIDLVGESGGTNSLFRGDNLLPHVPSMLAFRSSDSCNAKGAASFRMSSAHTHSSGALVMQGCPPVNEDLNTLPGQRRLELDHDLAQPFGSFDGNSECDENVGDGCYISLTKEVTDLEKDRNVDPMELSVCNRSRDRTQVLLETAAMYGVASETRREELLRPAKDPFLMLDPHDVDGSFDRPLRVGKTYRIPHNRPDKENVPKYHAKVSSGANLTSILLGDIPHTASIRTYLALPEVRLRYSEVIRKRSIVKRQRTKHSQELVSTDGLKETDCEPEMDPFGNDGDVDSEEIDGQDLIDSPEHLRLPDNSASDRDEHPELSLFPDPLNDVQMSSELELLASSFEETCRKYLEKTAWMWEQKTTDIKLLRRVEEWKDRIRPLLDEEEVRDEFDIVRCSQDVLMRVDASSIASGDRRVNAKELFATNARYEVSRMFLSTLQLANNYTIEIEPAGEDLGLFFSVQRTLQEGIKDMGSHLKGKSARKNRAKRIRQPGSTPKSVRRQPLRPRLEPQALH